MLAWTLKVKQKCKYFSFKPFWWSSWALHPCGSFPRCQRLWPHPDFRSKRRLSLERELSLRKYWLIIRWSLRTSTKTNCKIELVRLLMEEAKWGNSVSKVLALFCLLTWNNDQFCIQVYLNMVFYLVSNRISNLKRWNEPPLATGRI